MTVPEREWKFFICIRNLCTVISESHRKRGSEGITTELKLPIIFLKCPGLNSAMLYETRERKSEMNLLSDFRKVTFYPGELVTFNWEFQSQVREPLSVLISEQYSESNLFLFLAYCPTYMVIWVSVFWLHGARLFYWVRKYNGIQESEDNSVLKYSIVRVNYRTDYDPLTYLPLDSRHPLWWWICLAALVPFKFIHSFTRVLSFSLLCLRYIKIFIFIYRQFTH